MHHWLEARGSFRSPWERWFTPDAEAFSHDGLLWSDDKLLLFVLANPRATTGDFNRFKQAVQWIRADVRELQHIYPGVEVGITGRAVLDADEMEVAQRDTTIATLIALVGVALLFAVFFKGIAKSAFIIITLTSGFSWSLGFTTLTIGHLNIFTIIFAPMLMGLGIDYGIHFIAVSVIWRVGSGFALGGQAQDRSTAGAAFRGAGRKRCRGAPRGSRAQAAPDRILAPVAGRPFLPA
jgi:hypothetical protein